MAPPPPERRMPPREACRTGAPPRRLHHVSSHRIPPAYHPCSAPSSCSSICNGYLRRPGLFAVLPCRFPHHRFYQNHPAKREPRCLFRGATLLLVLQFPQFPGHAHPDLAAFGRIPADHAIPVLVASPPPAGVRVGEARVHARPVAQARAAGEPGAVVARDGDARRPAADARRWEPVRESGNATSSRRHARAATRDHRRSHDGRWCLRGLARLRSALRRAGPAM